MTANKMLMARLDEQMDALAAAMGMLNYWHRKMNFVHHTSPTLMLHLSVPGEVILQAMSIKVHPCIYVQWQIPITNA